MALRASGPRSATEVETTLFRALAVLRVLVLVYVVVLNATRWRDFGHPVVGWLLIGLIAAWSGFVTWAYDGPGRRRAPLLVADVAVAVLALLLTPYVQSDAMLERHASTIPSFWVMTPVLAWAVAGGLLPGLVAAAVVSLVDLSMRDTWTGTNWGNIFLLVLGASMVGYSSQLLREATEARALAERTAAATEERTRLARTVHDGVLQVLALVRRRGLELGGEAAELGRLAGDQEVALRSLVQGWAGAPAGRGELQEGARDLVGALASLGSRSVTVSGPGAPVRLPSPVVDEVTAVVRACLDNVARHVGEDAPAWVLVEDLGESVVVTVRDQGSGIPQGRLDAARAEGRLGVTESICGRMRDLGGSASLVTAPGQGTEWELTLPRG